MRSLLPLLLLTASVARAASPLIGGDAPARLIPATGFAHSQQGPLEVDVDGHDWVLNQESFYVHRITSPDGAYFSGAGPAFQPTLDAERKHILVASAYDSQLTVRRYVLGASDGEIVARGRYDFDLVGEPRTGKRPAVSPTGEVCAPFAAGLVCAPPVTEQVEPVALRFTPTDISALPLDPALIAAAGGVATSETTFIAAHTFGPDGTYYALVSRAFRPTNVRFDYLVARAPDGAVRLLMGPAPNIPTNNGDLMSAYEGITRMFVEPRTQSLWLYGVADWDWSNAETTVGIAHDRVPGDWRSIGVRIVPLAQPFPGASGYISLSQPVHDLYATRNDPNCRTWGDPHCLRLRVMDLAPAADGTLLFQLSEFDTLARPDQAHFKLEFDPDDFDLDMDGLSAREERDLGTSDYAADSDGSGVDDNAEALFGTNPADSKDDVVRRVPPAAVQFGHSPLLQWRLADIKAAWTNGTPSPSPADVHFPVCLDHVCYGPRGEVVAVTPTQATRVSNTRDGGTIAWATPEEVRARRLRDGSEWVLATKAQFSSQFSIEGLPRVDAVDDRTFFISGALPGFGIRVLLWRDGVLTERLDTSRLGPDNKPAAGGPVPRVMGVHPESGALMVAAYARFGSWVIAVPVEGDPRTVLDAHRMVGMRSDGITFLNVATAPWALIPELFLPLSTGELITNGYGLDVGLKPFAPDARFIADVKYEPLWSPDSFWGVDSYRESNRQLISLERQQGGLQPGDTLTFSSLNEANTRITGRLRRMGLRGGAVEMIPDGTLLMLNPSGMHASPDGHVCLVDPDVRRVVEFQPLAANGRTYLDARFVAEGERWRDCRYDATGALHLLVEKPARVDVVNTSTGNTVSSTPIPQPSEGGFPRQLRFTPEGAIDVLWSSDPDVMGRDWLKDGRRIEIRKRDGALLVNGLATQISLEAIRKETRDQAFRTPGGTFDVTGALVQLGERLDGLVVLNISDGASTIDNYVAVVDLDRERTSILSIMSVGFLHQRTAMTVVPWTTPRDTWADGPPVRFFGPAIPATPADKDDLPPSPVKTKQGCGSMPLTSLSLITLLFWWRTSRRRNAAAL